MSGAVSIYEHASSVDLFLWAWGSKLSNEGSEILEKGDSTI